MKIVVESTPEIAELSGGVKCRIWKGKTEGGQPVIAFIAAVGVSSAHDHTEFLQDLNGIPSADPIAKALEAYRS